MASSTASRSIRTELQLRMVLVTPPKGVRYGIQRGRGSSYEVDVAQQPKRGDATVEFAIGVVKGRNGQPDFRGDYVQGPVGRRFIYIDVGRYAGQTDTPWARRMIIRLDHVTWALVRKAIKAGKRLEARIQGTGSDGGPSCGTVKAIGGWKVVDD